VRSLRGALLVTLLGAVTAATAVGAVAAYRIARREIDAIFDYHLRQLALSLRDRALGFPGPNVETGSDLVIQIWGPDGARLYVSSPGAELPDEAVIGFATVSTPSGAWRVYSAALGDQVIQVGQPLSVRGALAFAAAVRTLAPLFLLLLLLPFLVWTLVGRGLAPLDRLARAVATRTPLALDPLPEQGVPEEVRPLVRSLNGLMERLSAALESQRAFVADAAHELRTPLAALKLQAQLAERARDAGERTSALAELEVGLDRAGHLVKQLLTLAREERGAGEKPGEEAVALGELAAQTIADHARLAEAKGVDLGATAVDERAVVRGDPVALRTLLANLVDNAVRYTPSGGRVDVAVGVGPAESYLEVSDSGPGIPARERERVFDRFYRRPGTREEGSGLGLAIVKAIAERHGARVALGTAATGGLTVKVEFPLTTPTGTAALKIPLRESS